MSDIKYNRIDEDLQQKIISNRESHWINPYAFKDEMAVRRNNDIDKANLWRPVFVRDVEKIMHLPYYNRYADKTQVFSFKNNDDITRRAQHVQLVSRIARNIGSVLGLNLDLIEAIALGHDIGHTPFGHAGERFLSELYHNETNRYFNHNVHSARVLDTIFARNFTMQTLDGVLCHNGEFEQQGYKPKYEKSFDDYDTEIESCYTEGIEAIKKLIPSTLEGCVVRICDMIAYLGKDRQDAALAGIIDPDYEFTTKLIGRENAKIINNLTVNEIKQINNQNNYLDMLAGIQVYMDKQDSLIASKSQDGYHILIFNYETRRLRIKYFKPSQSELANKTYANIESSRNENKIDAVLVRASSIKGLKIAYPNYFADIHEFIDIVNSYL